MFQNLNLQQCTHTPAHVGTLEAPRAAQGHHGAAHQGDGARRLLRPPRVHLPAPGEDRSATGQHLAKEVGLLLLMKHFNLSRF